MKTPNISLTSTLRRDFQSHALAIVLKSPVSQLGAGKPWECQPDAPRPVATAVRASICFEMSSNRLLRRQENWQETVPFREWLEKTQHVPADYLYFTVYLYFLTEERSTGRSIRCSEEYYCPYTDQLKHKFLSWWVLQTRTGKKKKISGKRFTTSSWDAISIEETHHLIFQTT